MDLTRTKLSLLIVFDAIARTGSVTQAAEQMSMTQPALSHSLARLREMFNDPLFIRGKGGLVMTPKAESLVAPVRGLLDSASSLLQPPEFDPATSDKELRVGLSECSMIMLGLPALMRLRTQAPGMKIVVQIVDRVSDRSVQEGLLDLGLWYSNQAPSALLSDALIVDRYVGAVHATHPLAAQCREGIPVTAEQYISYKHIHTVLRGLDDNVTKGVTSAGLSRSVTFVANSFLTNFPMMIASGTIATLPSMLVRAARLMAFDVVAFELPFEVKPISYRLMWSERTDADPASAWVRQVFREVGAPRAV